MRILIVGAGLAGLRTAEAVRAAGWNGELVVVGDELHPPYDRPPLSKQYLAGELAADGVALRQRRSVHDVRWERGAAVVGADLDARTVMLDSGRELAYDGLAIATGLQPRRLRVPGPTPGRYAVRRLEDAAALAEWLKARVRVVVVGAGFLGCEIAATARSLGCEVTVVAPEAVPLERPLGGVLGAAVHRRHEEAGVRWRLGTNVAAFEGEGRVRGVRLDDGTVEAADVVVEAVGSEPAASWLGGTDLDVTDGVLTDARMRAVTPLGVRPEVVAVGDVARYPHPLAGLPLRVEHWSNATDTARVAGRALAATLLGLEAPPPIDAVPSFWSDQYDLHLQAFGLPQIATSSEVVGEVAGGGLVVAYRRGEDLVGVAGIGATDVLLEWRQRLAPRRAAATDGG